MKIPDNIRLKSCPFCGMEIDHEDEYDTLYPGGWWRVTNGIVHFVNLKEREEGDKRVWKLWCNETYGGCGVEMSDLTIEGVCSKWNRRQ